MDTTVELIGHKERARWLTNQPTSIQSLDASNLPESKAQPDKTHRTSVILCTQRDDEETENEDENEG